MCTDTSIMDLARGTYPSAHVPLGARLAPSEIYKGGCRAPRVSGNLAPAILIIIIIIIVILPIIILILIY